MKTASKRVALGAGVVAVLASGWAWAQLPGQADSGVSPTGQVPPGAATLALPAGGGGGFTLYTFSSQAGQTEYAIQSALSEFSRADNEEARAAAVEKVSKLLGEQFDQRQKQREENIAQIEARVKKLRETLKKRTDARGPIIKARLEQLLREAEGLGWGDDSGSDWSPDIGMPPPSGALDIFSPAATGPAPGNVPAELPVLSPK